MGKNNIIKLSKIISDEIGENTNIHEIDFAIKEIEKLLLVEGTRKEITEHEISLKKLSSYIHLFNLQEYLEQIETNIQMLDNFIEILNTKKRLLELNNKKNIFIKDLLQPQ